MYNDIGKKIQGWAKAIFVVETIAAIITGAIVISESDELVGFLIIFCGPLVAWVSSWLLYGFGEIIVKLTEIESNTRYLKLKQEQSAKEMEIARQEERRRQVEKNKAELREHEAKVAKMAQDILNNANTSANEEKNELSKDELYQKLSYALQYSTDEFMIRYLERIDDETVKSILQSPKNSIRSLVISTRAILKTELDNDANK